MSYGIKVLLVLLATCSVTLQTPFVYNLRYGSKPNINLNPIAGIPRVYYHEQTVAVFEFGPQYNVENCDIIEVYEPYEKTEILKKYSTTLQPKEIPFAQMIRLMHVCEIKDTMLHAVYKTANSQKSYNMNHYSLLWNSLMKGIYPGTKWCGTGDVAKNYHDIGGDSVDICCRTHDLCPIKIRSYHTRFNLTNYSSYSKSHCDCDKSFYHCLKSIDSPSAKLIGQIFFNIIKVQCIEDLSKIYPSKKHFKNLEFSF